MTGFAQLFASNGIGSFDTSGVYPAGATAIFLGLTPDQPDRAITLMSYPVEDTDLTNVITGFQIRFRGGRDPREVENISDSIYDLLHNRSQYDVNGIHIELSWRQSGSWMGQDQNQRVERVENFYLHAERAAPHQLA
jgi:hypothetical protein